MDRDTKSIVAGYLTDLKNTLERLPVEEITKVVEIIAEARDKGRRIYIFGNGGSAATAAHMVCDLVKGSRRPEKKPIKAFSLTDNIPLFTAWGNDSEYGAVFSEQLASLIEPGDIALAISGSGESQNVLAGLKTARAKGAVTVGFTGFQGGQMKAITDHLVIVPSNSLEQIEDIHLVLDHIIRTCLVQASD